MLKKWDELPQFMRTSEVKIYYESLDQKRIQLCIKRIFDVVMASVLLIVLALPMIIIAIWIKLDSKGPVFYRQERITTYGKKFKIHKFRTMVDNADKLGSAVTISSDDRITTVGKKLRNLRLDEIPQLIDVLYGDMSFVGTRPEVEKYVKTYKPEYYATLLLPAGITSDCSIEFKDENRYLSKGGDVDTIYIEKILPQKMTINLKSIVKFSVFNDFITMFKTVFAVLGKE